MDTVWDDPLFVSAWNTTYGLDMSKAKARVDLLFPLFENRVGGLTDKTLVDLGCGNGNLIKHFQDTNFRNWTGIDNGSAVIASAADSVQDPRARFIKQDITAPLSIEHHTADITTAFFVVEEIPNANLDGLFINMRETLKPDGTAIIFCNHPAYAMFQNWQTQHFGTPEKFEGHQGYFDRKPTTFALTDMNQKNGHAVKPSYYHKTISDLSNSAFRNGLAVSHMLEIPKSALSFGMLNAAPVSGDFPRFLYLELKPARS